MKFRIGCIVATCINLMAATLVALHAYLWVRGLFRESRTPFEPDAYGMPVHGGYRFSCGDGDTSRLYAPDGPEIVPDGAVLSVVRTGYCIGYRDGEAFYLRNGKRIDLDRVFFVIYPDGKLEFCEPWAGNPDVAGEKIPEEVHFKRNE